MAQLNAQQMNAMDALNSTQILVASGIAAGKDDHGIAVEQAVKGGVPGVTSVVSDIVSRFDVATGIYNKDRVKVGELYRDYGETKGFVRLNGQPKRPTETK